MAINYVSSKEYKLNQAISSSDTSIVLQSMTKPGDDDELTMANFGEIGYATIDPRTSKKELISFTGITQSTTDDTATLTGVVRGLEFITPYTTASDLQKAHSGGAKLIISNPPQLYDKLTNKENTETINEAWTFAQGASTSAGDPSGDNEFARKAYVDSVVNGGTVSINRVVVAGNAGETVSAGDVLYFKNSDQEWYLADASSAATSQNVQLGIAQGAGTDGNAITTGVLISGLDSNQSGLTPGDDQFLSDTAGALATSAGTEEVFVGVAKSATEVIVNFKSEDSTNLTNDDAYTTDTDQSQTTENAVVEYGEADSTTNKAKIAQSFIPTKESIRGVRLWKGADTGTFTGTVTVSIQADSSGSPSGSALATQTLTNGNYTGVTDDTEVQFVFDTEYESLVVGDTYWIVAETSTNDNSNHPNLGTNSAGGYANGSVKYENTTDSWTAIATIDLYFKTDPGIQSEIIQTDSSGNVPARIKGFNRVIGASATAVRVENTTTETDLVSVTIPGGYIGSNLGVRTTLYIVDLELENSPDTDLTLTAKYGGTTVATIVLDSDTGQFLVGSGRVECLLIGAGSETSQNAFLNVTASDGSTDFDAPPKVYSRTVEGSATEDSTMDQTFVITATFSTADANGAIESGAYTVEGLF